MYDSRELDIHNALNHHKWMLSFVRCKCFKICNICGRVERTDLLTDEFFVYYTDVTGDTYRLEIPGEDESFIHKDRMIKI
jgi:hypothetical protein